MYYIILAFMCFLFGYALFIDGKHKIDITYDVLSKYNDIEFDKPQNIIFKTDKKKYHFKSAFIGVSLINNSEDTVEIEKNSIVEIKHEDNWYVLETDNFSDKFIKIKKKEDYYQNIFIDMYKNLNECELRIIKKIRVNNEEKIMVSYASIHTKKMLREKVNLKNS